MIFAYLALGFAVLALGLHLASAVLTMLRYRKPSPRNVPADAPLITLLRPVCGLDNHDEETLGSTFHLSYPNLEIIFCAAREEDPAVALLQKLIAQHPQVNARVMVGEDRITANPKLNNLEKGWQAARGDFVAMTDSNLLLPTDYIEQLLAAFRPDTGLVTSPPIGVRGEGMAAALECAFLNGFQGRWQLAADSVGLGYAQGKTLMWRRDVLERAGGLVSLGRDLAEDVASTKRVRDQGLKVRLTRQAFTQPIGPRSFGAVWARQLRWARVRRDGFVGLFAAEILLGPFVPLAALVPLFGWATLPTALPFLGLWYGAELAMMRFAGWPSKREDITAMVLRDLLLAPLWLQTWRSRGFEWRGSAMAPGVVSEVKV
ncbi:ceramide glucosyltransferase [Rhodobacter sp. JA431]|uniref:ceramide glucosyltransferase n=1 Tax=Rhodobacter sp. JA431 TaxID=570013 RepID=UPI000BCF05B9|nr:ceramide glucosyltransferase [Rhodobacter sp. JA431]SOC16126.1 ceramide glucosyltransferase [Rhodobacter sp. JA431]